MKQSVHLGLDQVSAGSYGGWNGKLEKCRKDATDLAELFARAGYTSRVMLDGACTRDAFCHALRELAAGAKPGDSIVLSYSGHGGQHDSWVQDQIVETFCLYDGELLDYEFRGLLSEFAKGVTLVGILDCCHAQGLYRALRPRRPRAMPASISAFLDRNPSRSLFFDRPVHANTLLLFACTTGQVSYEGDHNGVWTGALLQSFAPMRTWGQWFFDAAKLVTQDTPEQTPCWQLLGGNDPRPRILS
jgi:metacaspase-1